jgi:hypothetical protein
MFGLLKRRKNASARNITDSYPNSQSGTFAGFDELASAPFVDDQPTRSRDNTPPEAVRIAVRTMGTNTPLEPEECVLLEPAPQKMNTVRPLPSTKTIQGRIPVWIIDPIPLFPHGSTGCWQHRNTGWVVGKYCFGINVNIFTNSMIRCTVYR